MPFSPSAGAGEAASAIDAPPAQRAAASDSRARPMISMPFLPDGLLPPLPAVIPRELSPTTLALATRAA